MRPQEFIEAIKPAAFENYSRYGILPSITIAQAALESGWGKHHIKNNLFGIKWTEGCGYAKVARKTTEYINGQPKTVVAYFRAYDTFGDSILDHGRLLATQRYAAVRQATNYKDAAKALYQAGYATDPAYPDKLIAIIEKYKLYQLDDTVDWAAEAIAKAKEKGVMVGYPDGTWQPNKTVTRAELAVILDNLGLLD